MGAAADEWFDLGVHEFGAGLPRPRAVVDGWLREKGIEPADVADDEIRVDALCGREGGGAWSRECRILVPGRVLRRGDVGGSGTE